MAENLVVVRGSTTPTEYETAVKFGKFIVIAHSTADDIAKANLVLERPSSAHIDPLLRGEPRLSA